MYAEERNAGVHTNDYVFALSLEEWCEYFEARQLLDYGMTVKYYSEEGEIERTEQARQQGGTGYGLRSGYYLEVSWIGEIGDVDDELKRYRYNSPSFPIGVRPAIWVSTEPQQ